MTCRKKQMDFWVRIWENDRVRSRYFDTRFMGHGTALDMLNLFSTSVKESLDYRSFLWMAVM